MAYRYLVATGNWNDPAIWSATSGGAGGAGVPTDNDFVYIEGGYTVTLTASVNNFFYVVQFYSNSVLDLNGYAFNTQDGGILGTGKVKFSGGTLDAGSGYLNVTNIDFLNGTAIFSLGQAHTFNPTMTNTSNADITVRVYNPYLNTFAAGSYTFRDVRFNLESTSGGFKITGSPTFRTLDIRSANSAAHTVNFDGNIQVDKFIAIGSSTSNRLTFNAPSAMIIGDGNGVGTIYGQFVNMGVNVLTYDSALGYSYIGSNSIDGTGGYWLTQDPPKISTLVDPLTTAPGSNPNWTVTGTVTQVTTGHDGGGYKLASSTSSESSLVSTNTYDLVDSSYVVELDDDSYYSGISFTTGFTVSSAYSDILNPIIGVSNSISGGNIDSETVVVDYPSNTKGSIYRSSIPWRFSKVEILSSGVVTVSGSDDGLTWSPTDTFAVSTENLAMLRSVRVSTAVKKPSNSTASYILGSINPSLAIDIDTNSVSSSTAISTPSISRTASLSAQGHGVGTSISTTDIQSVIVLDMDSIGTSTSMSEPSMVLIKGILPNSMSIGVSADNLDLLLEAGLLPDSMEIVAASSIPSISGDVFIFTDDMLVGLNEDEVSVAALRNMDVDVMSIMPAILATAVQIGYPTGDINADNIYAIGSMREGEYGIATINNNQIYEVVEQDGI